MMNRPATDQRREPDSAETEGQLRRAASDRALTRTEVMAAVETRGQDLIGKQEFLPIRIPAPFDRACHNRLRRDRACHGRSACCDGGAPFADRVERRTMRIPLPHLAR